MASGNGTARRSDVSIVRRALTPMQRCPIKGLGAAGVAQAAFPCPSPTVPAVDVITCVDRDLELLLYIR